MKKANHLSRCAKGTLRNIEIVVSNFVTRTLVRTAATVGLKCDVYVPALKRGSKNFRSRKCSNPSKNGLSMEILRIPKLGKSCEESHLRRVKKHEHHGINPARKMFSSGCRPRLKNGTCLSSLIASTTGTATTTPQI